MGGLEDMAGKAEELAKEHPDQVKQGVEKAGQVADEKTGGQHSDQIDKAEQAAEDRLTGGSDQGGPDQGGPIRVARVRNRTRSRAGAST